MADAMAAQSAALGASVGAWEGLKQAAGTGQLRMEPGVAEQCAKHCEDLKHKLDEHLASAQQLGFLDGLGDCLIGRALGEKFNDKARAPTNSLTAVIRQHQQILSQMADTYRAAGAAFHRQEQLNQSALK